VTAPKYPDGATTGDKAASLESIWVVAAGGADQPNRLYAGTNPGGLFASDDGGKQWSLVTGLWDHPSREQWFGGGRDTAGIHSVVVDPRDSRRVLVGVSCGGVFETTDGGESWAPRNRGLKANFLPDPEAEVGQDPHLVTLCPAHPDTLWQQNHCGVYRSTDGAKTWQEISAPGQVYFGFPVVAHDTDPDTAWVVPAISDEVRMVPDGALQVFKTTDGGATWTSTSAGLPQQNAYDLVYRHAFDRIATGVMAMGTTTGNVYVSTDDGATWGCVGHNFPPVYSVRLAR